MATMLEKLSEELTYSALARNKVAELARNEGLQVNLDEYQNGYFDQKMPNNDVPAEYLGVDIRIFIGEKDGQKYLIGIPPKPDASTAPFMVTSPLTTVVKFESGNFRLYNGGGDLLFHALHS